MLKAVYAKLEDIPAGFESLFSERNGQYELTGVEGMRTVADVDRLQSALTKERADHKGVRERLALLGDRKIEEILVELDRIPELEAKAQGGSDDEKLQTLLEARLRTHVAPLERQLNAKAKELESLTSTLEDYKSQARTRSIHDAVRGALVDHKGFQATAVDDALMYAERMFEVVEGKALTRDGVGVTPGVEASVWLTEMQPKKTHWWGQSVGGGANGSGTSGGVSNPWSADHWNMTEQSKVYRQDPSRAEQLAKAAGTTIGGPRPEKRF